MPAYDLPIHPDQTPRLSSQAGLRVREDTLYTNHKGKEKKGIRKRTDKVLAKLQEVLSKTLEPEETILYVARGQAPASAFEQLAFSWYIYQVTGTVLVLTNRRLLHFHIKVGSFGRWSWTRSLRAVRWGDIDEAKVKGWLLGLTLRLKYRNGKKDTYWGLRRQDAKKIKLLLAALLPGSLAEVTPAQTMASLCPDCLAALTPGIYQCSQCSLTFKDEKTLVRRSLLIPGGGYFYTGYWFLGIGDFFVEASLLIVLLVSAGMATEPSSKDAWAAWVLTGMFAFLLGAEKYFTIRHCRRFIREYIPTK